ncbi:DMT family transporter [Desulfovibrio sp. OttesenSCG-928-O18]|nr:DMT family transporter [Desulfovibrio sp. OttesenSCG-928-O18]
MVFFGIGEIAGLLTALGWAGSCQVHTMASRILGGLGMTVARQPLLLSAILIVVFATGTDITTPASSLLFLIGSGFLAMVLTDPLLYSASVMVGPRIALLVQSLSACLTAIFGYVLMGEALNLMGWLGILTASCGVAFVLMEGGLQVGTGIGGLSRGQLIKGVSWAFLSAVSMAGSFLLLKQGMREGMQPMWAAFVRMGSGGLILWSIMLLRGQLFGMLRRAWTSWSIMRLLLFGCAVSTIGNCLVPVAMKYTQAGIAATLVSLQPIMIIIITSVMDRKLPTLRAVIGTVIAFSGTAMIFLR